MVHYLDGHRGRIARTFASLGRPHYFGSDSPLFRSQCACYLGTSVARVRCTARTAEKASHPNFPERNGIPRYSTWTHNFSGFTECRVFPSAPFFRGRCLRILSSARCPMWFGTLGVKRDVIFFWAKLVPFLRCNGPQCIVPDGQRNAGHGLLHSHFVIRSWAFSSTNAGISSN